MENETGHPVLEKLKTLRDKFNNPAYPDDLTKIDTWQKEAQDLVLRETLCANDTLQTILKKYAEDIKETEKKLMTLDSVALPDTQRDRLIDKVDLYKGFLQTFDLAAIRKSLESVDKEVSEELVNLNT